MLSRYLTPNCGTSALNHWPTGYTKYTRNSSSITWDFFLKQIFKWLHPKTQREKMMVLLSWQIIKQCWQFFSFFISIFCQWSLSFCRCGCFFKLSSSHLMNQMVFRWTLSPWCITELFHERNDWIFIESPTSRILICPVYKFKKIINTVLGINNGIPIWWQSAH